MNSLFARVRSLLRGAGPRREIEPETEEEPRGSRGPDRMDPLRFSWLDFKVGFRMLARYPGLTLVGNAP